MAGLSGISGLTNFNSLNVNPTGAVATQATSRKTSNPVPVPAMSPDQATVSSTGSLVAQALSTSDVRHDRVSQLQEAIASGSYSVSSADLAGKIVDSLLR